METVVPPLEDRLMAAIRSIRYGTIEVVIHDGRVVQIEKRERIRLPVADQHDQPPGSPQ